MPTVQSNCTDFLSASANINALLGLCTTVPLGFMDGIDPDIDDIDDDNDTNDDNDYYDDNND